MLSHEAIVYCSTNPAVAKAHNVNVVKQFEFFFDTIIPVCNKPKLYCYTNVRISANKTALKLSWILVLTENDRLNGAV